MGKNVAKKSSQDFEMAGNVPYWENLDPIFSNGSLPKTLGRRDISTAPVVSVCMPVTAMQRYPKLLPL